MYPKKTHRGLCLAQLVSPKKKGTQRFGILQPFFNLQHIFFLHSMKKPLG